jgi:hypothetical protein
MNTSSSSGSSGVIFPRYKRNDEPLLLEEKYKPLDPREKFSIATLDPFDGGTVALGALFAAEAHRQGILARSRTGIFSKHK